MGLPDPHHPDHAWPSAFVEGDILQIIFLAVIIGVALNALGPIGAPLLDLVQRRTKVMFKILSYIMKLAPLGAFGAMAYAIGKYGISTLTSLGSLIGLFYLTSAFFVLVVLGAVMALPEVQHLQAAALPQGRAAARSSAPRPPSRRCPA